MSSLIPVRDLVRSLKLHKQRRHFSVIAAMGEVSAKTLHTIVKTGKMTVRMQGLLSELLPRLDRGDFKVKHNAAGQVSPDNVNKLLVEERPRDAPHTQRRIMRAAEYSPWARCIACGGTRFSGVKRFRGHKFRYYACDDCVDTPDRIMMGGKPTDQRQ